MAVGSYATTTLAQALVDLSQRLMDPSFVRWTEDELTIYLQQAIRTWNALTAEYRESASFQTTLAEPFYDLPTILPTLREQTYSLQDAVDQVCHHLLEPVPVLGVWDGTLQYNLPQVIRAIAAARDEFLMETGAVLTRSLVAVSPFPSDGQVDLDEIVINIRRVSWNTADGIKIVLRRDDQWGTTNYARRTWVTPSSTAPKAYSVGETPPLVVQLAPISTQTGDLDLITIDRGVDADYTVADQSLGVPNDWAWVVIFGALSELMSKDGIAFDPHRAAYCEARWQHGIDQAKAAAVVLAARVQGSPVELGSISDADAYDPGWQMVTANVRRVLQDGHTLIAAWPPPGVPTGGGNYTIDLDVVRNAPVPTADGDFIQLGPEVLDAVLDYAQHLALFKEGIAQIQQSETLLTRFMGMAGTEVAMQWASQPNRDALLDQTTQDPRVVPLEVTNKGTIN